MGGDEGIDTSLLSWCRYLPRSILITVDFNLHAYQHPYNFKVMMILSFLCLISQNAYIVSSSPLHVHHKLTASSTVSTRTTMSTTAIQKAKMYSTSKHHGSIRAFRAYSNQVHCLLSSPVITSWGNLTYQQKINSVFIPRLDRLSKSKRGAYSRVETHATKFPFRGELRDASDESVTGFIQGSIYPNR